MFSYLENEIKVVPIDRTYVGFHIIDNCTKKIIPEGIVDCGDRFDGKYKGWYCLNENIIFVDKGNCSRIVIDFYKCNKLFNKDIDCKSDEEIDKYVS